MEDRTPRGDAQARQRVALSLLFYAQTHHKRRLVRRILPGALVILAIILVWLAGGAYGAKYELEGAPIPARNAETRLRQLMLQKADAYRLRISRPDGTHQDFSLREMGVRLDVNGSLSAARQERRAFKNRLLWWRPVPVRMTLSADAEVLEAFVARYTTVIVEPAQNASIELVDGIVQITDGTDGKQYGLEDPMHTILTAVSSLRSEPLRMRAIALEPDMTAESLASTKRKLDAILEQSIVIMVGDQEVHPGRDQIASWLTLTPDPVSKTIAIGIDMADVQTYMGYVADDHAAPPKARVILSSGGVIAGTTGVTVTNTQAAVDTLSQKLLDGAGLRIDMPTRNVPFTTINAAAASRWIEVDVTYKRLYAYEQDRLVRTFLVSAGAPATPTVLGTYAIYTKFSRQTMRGPNADGTHYVQPDVPWVNYFYSDFAIHGNYWRPVGYFGHVNSSHGCVGLLPGDAAWLYSWAYVGTPVVVHK